MTADPGLGLLDDSALEQSSVVANNAMNRNRGLVGVNSYARELGFDPYRLLAAGLETEPGACATWVDVCCGSGRALLAAESRFAAEFPCADVTLRGIDLAGHFAGEPSTPRLRLITTPARNWSPDRPANLVTCVHGLHYVGDKLALIAAMTRWTAAAGKFAAHFDPHTIRHADGSSAARTVLSRLRAAGLAYDGRRHRISASGPVTVEFRAEYLGADDRSGPGYTGQPAVTSYYDW